jgi:3-oxoadipate enol-lactonase
MAECELVEAGGVALRCRRTGTDGPALVLLHEMGGALESWDEVIAQLGAGYRILAHDLRGFGLSEKMRGSLLFADLADDTAGLIRHYFRDEKVWIAGCAVGAAVGLQLAASMPGLVAGIVAFAPATGVPEADRPVALARIAALEGGGLRAFFPEVSERQFPVRFRTDPRRVQQFHLRRLVCDAQSYAAVWRAMLVCDLEERLDQIKCPVTVVAGSLDTTRSPERLKVLAGRIPGARFTTIESGHAIPVIAPEATATVIANAIAAHP